MCLIGCLIVAGVFTVITFIILFFFINSFIKKQYTNFLEKKLERLYSPLFYYANKTIYNLSKVDFENLNLIIKNNFHLASNELRPLLQYFIKSNPKFEERQKKGKLGAIFSHVLLEFKELSENYKNLNQGIRKK